MVMVVKGYPQFQGVALICKWFYLYLCLYDFYLHYHHSLHMTLETSRFHVKSYQHKSSSVWGQKSSKLKDIKIPMNSHSKIVQPMSYLLANIKLFLFIRLFWWKNFIDDFLILISLQSSFFEYIYTTDNRSMYKTHCQQLKILYLCKSKNYIPIHSTYRVFQ